MKIFYGTLNCNHKQECKSLRIDLCLKGFYHPENQIEGQKCFLSFKILAENHACIAPDKSGY